MCWAAGGIAVTLVGHPFDTTKVRLQTQSSTNPIYCEWADPLPVLRLYMPSQLSGI